MRRGSAAVLVALIITLATTMSAAPASADPAAAEAQWPAAAAAGPAIAKHALAEMAAADARQNAPCRLSKVGDGYRVELLVRHAGPWSPSVREGVVPSVVPETDYCAPLRDACARGGDCSMYMCCRFGDVFCLTSTPPQRARPVGLTVVTPALDSVGGRSTRKVVVSAHLFATPFRLAFLPSHSPVRG